MRHTIWICALAATAGAASAQQAGDSTARRQQRVLDSLAASIKALEARLDSLGAAVAATPAPPAARASGSYMNIGFDGLIDAGASTQRNVAGLQRGDHDPHVSGFTIPNAELVIDATVDPYFKAFANIVYKLDANGETGVELEEMFVLTTSLPANLQLKAGQFVTEFGRQNAQHPHAWSFVDQPLVLNRMFGPDGMRSQGARVSWLLPTSWYLEAAVSVLNSAGSTAYSFRSDASSEIHGGIPFDRGVRTAMDMAFVPRLAASIDLTETQVVVVGASAALGPNNSGPDASTAIYGGDVYWKWKSPTAHQGFPFISWQTEALYRKYDAAQRISADGSATILPAETLKDWGAYSQLLWGVKPMVVLGIRGDIVRGNTVSVTTPERLNGTRVSPNVTWYPSEFSKVRLQYNYDDRELLGHDHSLWLQFEFILGAHAAHKF